MPEKNNKIWIGRIIFLIIILLIALFMFTWSGTIRCSKIPGWCEMYWGVQTIITGRQQPSILILSDPSGKGMGNPERLRELLANREIAGYHANLGNINYLSADQLSGVSLIIVEHARQISTNTLITLMNYVTQGGRLIWIGDSGLEKAPEDTYFENPLTKEYTGWQRVDDENNWIRFDTYIGVKYITNFCDLKNCSSNNRSGKLIASTSHPLVRGLKQNLLIYDDYSIVKLIEPNPTPLKVDFGSNLIDNDGKNYGDIFPLIVTSHSNKVVYYAIPPEMLAEEEDEEKYYLIIENMVSGMFN
jgi:hypothetical protein